MQITYSLQNEDFLVHQLYIASQSERVKKKRTQSTFIPPVVYILIGMYLAYRYQTFVPLALFGGLGILWYLLYPKYEKMRYRKHYWNFIKDNFQEKVNVAGTIIFESEHVKMFDHATESKTSISEIKYAVNLPNHYLIRFKGSQVLIIPKKEVKSETEFFQYFTSKNIEIKDELNWEWK